MFRMRRDSFKNNRNLCSLRNLRCITGVFMTTTRSLRQYQQELIYNAGREIAKGFRAVLIQLVTGGGKTRMVAHIINNATNGFTDRYDATTDTFTHVKVERPAQTVWFIVPRKELLWQSSEELKAWGINHGMISAKSKESAAFNTHIVSAATGIKRIKEKKIRKSPDVIIIDEGHLALDQQLLIKEHFPDALIIRMTATPEKLDGRGLNELGGSIVYGPSLQWMVEGGFLKRPWVLGIPAKDRITEGQDLKFSKTGDLTKNSNAQLDALYKARAKGGVLYGDAIKHYREHGLGRSFLIFCRSLDQCKEVAQEFTNDGLRVEDIDGTMTDKVRKDKIDKVRSGRLDGLTTRDLVTYGLDVPKISCIIMLRPTASVALFFQMIGRGLRPDPEYSNCLILDHVGNCDDKAHGHPLAPRVWNFEGNEKKKKPPKNAVELIDAVDKCKICYGKIINGICETCGAEKQVMARGPLKELDGFLVEITEPTPLRERPPENQRHYTDMINNNVDRFRACWYGDDGSKAGVIDHEAIKNLIEAGHDLAWKQRDMQVYYKCHKPGDRTVNVSLLSAIGKIRGHHANWAARKREFLENKLLQQNQSDAYYDQRLA